MNNIFIIADTIYNLSIFKEGDSMKDSRERIIKVKKNSEGDITDVMTDNGNIYSIDDAIVLAKNHALGDVNVSRSRNGNEYLRSDPNGDTSDNLNNLPTF